MKAPCRKAACFLAVFLWLAGAWTGAALAENDRLTLKDGSQLSGTITAVNENRFTIQVTDEATGVSVEKVIPRDDVLFSSSRRTAPSLAASEETIRVGAARPAGDFQYARVKEVVSADIFMLEEGGFVKLLGVQMEKDLDPGSGGQTFSGRGKAMVERLLEIEGNEIRMEFDAERYDENKKLLAYVYVGHDVNTKSINQRLLELGYARYVPPEEGVLKHHEALAEAQNHARTSELGLWRYEGLSEIEQMKSLRSLPVANWVNPYSGYAYNSEENWEPRTRNRPLSQRVPITPDMMTASEQREAKTEPGQVVGRQEPAVEPVRVESRTTEPGSVAAETSPAPASAAQNETVKLLIEQNKELMKMLQEKDKKMQETNEQMQKLLLQLLEKQTQSDE